MAQGADSRIRPRRRRTGWWPGSARRSSAAWRRNRAPAIATTTRAGLVGIELGGVAKRAPILMKVKASTMLTPKAWGLARCSSSGSPALFLTWPHSPFTVICPTGGSPGVIPGRFNPVWVRRAVARYHCHFDLVEDKRRKAARAADERCRWRVCRIGDHRMSKFRLALVQRHLPGVCALRPGPGDVRGRPRHGRLGRRACRQHRCDQSCARRRAPVGLRRPTPRQPA